jgi:hypothetical protein
MKVGDLVRWGWDGKKRRIAAPYKYGIVLEVHLRSAEHYSAKRIAKDPIRTVKVLCNDGRVQRWYNRHAEVVSESR